jgi:hypothetical protein
MRGRWVIGVAAAAAAAAAAAPAAVAQPRDGLPAAVPSHQPKQTHALWTKLVRRARLRTTTASPAGCRPLRAIVYTADDWLRLATKLAANASPCAQYFISIPPLAADKTNFRSAQPAQIRALGPQFHVLAEISYNGWTNWVTHNNSTYEAAGVEARRRMAAQGFDVGAGDSWIVNEASSALRSNTGTSRQKIRDLVRGLYEGDGTVPRVKGGVYVVGLSQATPDLTTYKLNLQSWYGDTPFWQDMSAYVADWSQEVYGDVRDYAVAGAAADERAAYLNDYLQHPLALADAAPAEVATAADYLRQSYSPLANAAWAYDSGFGFTNVDAETMKDYVSAQVYALRSFDAARGSADRFGFAWAPRMPDGSAWTSSFTTQTGELLDRLAAAIHESDSSPAAACGPSACAAALSGAAFTDAWKTFASWSPPTLVFASSSVAVAAGSAGQLTVQLQQADLPQTAATPVSVSFAASSPTAQFAPAADGPWTPTLTAQIPPGGTSASVYVRDSATGSFTVTASAPGWQAATQGESVTSAPEPPAAGPSGGGGGGGGGVAPDLTVSLTPSASTAPAVGAELDLVAAVTTKNAGGSSSASLEVDLPAGYVLARVYADRGSCTSGGGRVSCDVAWINPTTSTHVTLFGTVGQAGELRFTATVASRQEPDLDPSSNVVQLTLAPPAAAAESPRAPQVVVLRAVRRPRIRGAAAAGRTLRAVAPAWTHRPVRVVYRWQLCRRSACRLVRGTRLRLRSSDAGRTVRLLVTGSGPGTTVRTASRRVLVRRR